MMNGLWGDNDHDGKCCQTCNNRANISGGRKIISDCTVDLKNDSRNMKARKTTIDGEQYHVETMVLQQ